MMRTKGVWYVAALCCGAFMIGCGEGEADVGGSEITEASSDALIGGVASLERSEIGRIFYAGRSSCTATLIHPRVVLTAKHCVAYRSCDDDCQNPRAGFEIYRPGRPSSIYSVEHFSSLNYQGDPVPAGEVGRNRLMSFREGYALNDDVAVVLLKDPVPESVAKPAKLAEAWPESGQKLTAWGFGCTDRQSMANAGTKRKYHFTQDQKSDVLCPGDSGGPLTERGTYGGVYFVNSGFWDNGEGLFDGDVFGDVVRMRPEIDAQLEKWGITLPGGSPDRYDPAPVQPEEPEEPAEPECRPFATEPPEQGMPMRISLVWPEPTDLDLFVEDPAGQTIYYGNRSTPQGAQLKKADCVSSSCPALEDGSDYSEWVEWSGKPLEGTYKVWAVNYNGRATANFTIQIESDRGDVAFEGSLSGAREASGVGTFKYEDREICE